VASAPKRAEAEEQTAPAHQTHLRKKPAGNHRAAQRHPAGMVRVLSAHQPRVAHKGSMAGSADASVPSCASARDYEAAVAVAIITAGPRPTLPAMDSSACLKPIARTDSLTVKTPSTGEPDAGNPPVRFGRKGRVTSPLPHRLRAAFAARGTGGRANQPWPRRAPARLRRISPISVLDSPTLPAIFTSPYLPPPQAAAASSPKSQNHKP